MTSKGPYYVYIVECSDKSYYTGIAKELQKRLDEHNHSPKGAKYTKARRPVKLVYTEEASDRSSASKREAAIKRMRKEAKTELIISVQRA